MGYTIVSRPPDDPVEIELDGQTFPVPCVVSDRNGQRIFLVCSHLSSYQMAYAIEEGAVAIVDPTQGDYCLIADVEEWRPYTPGMSAIEMKRGMRRAVEPETPSTEFVHLHTHSECSALDGLSTVDEIVAAVVRDGNPAVAITDHGNCAAHPALQLACEKAGIKPIFGMEAYFVDDRHVKETRDYYHLVLWAMDDEGLRNLWAMSTEAYRSGFYYKPRLDWEILQRYSAGVLASTACLAGPVARPFLKGETETALSNLGRLMEIFGDRLYVELHANQLDEQLKVNPFLVQVAQSLDLPMIAVVDSHYAEAEHKHDHRLWLSIQTNSDVADDSSLFGGDQDYHLMTRDEVAKSLTYLGDDVASEAIANTARLAARCTARLVGKGHNPVFSRVTAEHPDPVAHDIERLRDKCEQAWARRTGGKREPEAVYRERYETELDLLIRKGFCGYFLMVADLVTYAKQHQVLVGPGRGSGGGSLVAYLCGITEIDPVEYDLLFARFMTEGRTSLPDFDIDFPSSRKQFMLDYVAERWGAEHMATVGTHLRLKSKGVVKDVARATRSQLPEDHWRDVEAVSAIIGEAEAGTAGLGLSWDDLWVQMGDQLQPYREKYPELFGYCDKLHGRLKTYGSHAAGVIIDPDDPLSGALPLRRDGDGGMVTQFDMAALESLGFVKFDLLNLRTLDTIQDTLDLIQEQTGEWVDPYAWDEELFDPQVYEEISAGWTLGMFQVETQTGTRMCTRFKPQSVADLKDVITLVRPGPARSGLTETYLRRKEGTEPVYLPDERLEPVLKKVRGCILYQENVMATVMTLAGYTSDEADKVRKILGKKKVDLVMAEGQKFVAQAVERGMERAAAQDLWAQMAEFAKYSFGEAHAVAYAILGYWTAWFKIHYPVQFLTAVLSTVKDERIPEFVEEARRMGYSVLPPDVNESGVGFTCTGIAVRYGLTSVKGVGEAAVAAILEPRLDGGPYTSYADFLARKGPKCNAGHIKTLVKIGAFDSLEPNRRGLERRIELEETAAKGTDVCGWKAPEPTTILWLPKPLSATERDELANPAVLTPERRTELQGRFERHEARLPCAYPWASEPDTLGRTGKPVKRKAPPKKCSRACRQFKPMELPDIESFAPYTDEDIQTIEMEMLGVFLTSTPFDRIPEEVKEQLSTGVDILVGDEGDYMLAGIPKGLRKHTTRGGDPMGFVKVMTEQGELDITVFPKYLALYEGLLVPGTFLFLAVHKNDRGLSLQHAALPGGDD